jgi:hypothetical protein
MMGLSTQLPRNMYFPKTESLSWNQNSQATSTKSFGLATKIVSPLARGLGPQAQVVSVLAQIVGVPAQVVRMHLDVVGVPAQS